jgi:hypothetical protein
VTVSVHPVTLDERSPAGSPDRNARATSRTPVTKAHAATQMVSASAVMSGQTSATTPAAAETMASSR